MSDHDGMTSDAGYDTPVPELDDHRHESASSQRIERPRRGTFDSLYGYRQVESDTSPCAPEIRIRDFEEAIIDEDCLDGQQAGRHGRRMTVETPNDGRSISPPNSVKAFAQARRRERDMSFSEPTREHEEGHGRSLSMSSRRSYRSRSRTIEKDAKSLLTDKAAEEDVCFPLPDRNRKNDLRIDFEYLENFISTERATHSADRQLLSPAFSDLRSGSSPQQLATIDGEILTMPSDDSMQEKKLTDGGNKIPANPIESNRFSFFSSAWESTIHAAEMGDLVLPGEDIRGLFELPKDEADGVWWLNINRTTKEEVQGICKAFGVHPLTIEDIITQEVREKIELFPSYYFACFRSFNVIEEPDGIEYEPFNIYVLVFREGTLSFSFAPNSHASQVRKRITALKEYVSLSSDWICYALM